MQIKLDIEHNWVEEGKNGKIVRRVMTFEEAIDYVCENCQDAESEIDLDIDFCRRSAEHEIMTVCRECGKQIIADKLADPEFIGNILITIL